MGAIEEIERAQTRLPLDLTARAIPATTQSAPLTKRTSLWEDDELSFRESQCQPSVLLRGAAPNREEPAQYRSSCRSLADDSIDPASRNLCDWCERGLRVVSVTQQIDCNGTVGKMLAAVLLGITEMEQETRRERQAAGIAVAKKEGKYRGRKPGTTKAKPAHALKLREKGLTAEEIATSLGVSRNTVFRYFRQARA